MYKNNNIFTDFYTYRTYITDILIIYNHVNYNIIDRALLYFYIF